MKHVPASMLIDARFDLADWTRAMVRREISNEMLCEIMYGPGVALAVFGVGELIRGEDWLSRAMVREIVRSWRS